MTRSRFTGSQIIVILKQAEVDTPVPEVCLGSVEPVFYKGVPQSEEWMLL